MSRYATSPPIHESWQSATLPAVSSARTETYESSVDINEMAGTDQKLEADQLQGRAFHSQGRNIRNYTQFLLERARAYRDTKVDYVRSGENRLKKLSIDKGLLRETEAVQHQITALVRCDVSSSHVVLVVMATLTFPGLG